MQISKQTKVGEVIDLDRETAQFFFELGMHCVGCPSARNETVEQACLVHNADADELVEKINGFLQSKE